MVNIGFAKKYAVLWIRNNLVSWIYYCGAGTARSGALFCPETTVLVGSGSYF